MATEGPASALPNQRPVGASRALTTAVLAMLELVPGAFAFVAWILIVRHATKEPVYEDYQLLGVALILSIGQFFGGAGWALLRDRRAIAAFAVRFALALVFLASVAVRFTFVDCTGVGQQDCVLFENKEYTFAIAQLWAVAALIIVSPAFSAAYLIAARSVSPSPPRTASTSLHA